MTDYEQGEVIWVVYYNQDGQAYVQSAAFISDTEWHDGGMPLVKTSVGLARVANVFKSHVDAQVSVQ